MSRGQWHLLHVFLAKVVQSFLFVFYSSAERHNTALHCGYVHKINGYTHMPFWLQMAQILPTDENFLVLFQLDHPLESSVDFMKVRKRTFLIVCLLLLGFRFFG